MTKEDAALVDAAAERVVLRALEIFEEEPEFTIEDCVEIAVFLEIFVNGNPGGETIH